MTRKKKRIQSRLPQAKQPRSYLIISYWPLINLNDPTLYENDNILPRMDTFLKDQDEVVVDGCMWIDDGNGLAPVFIMSNATAVYEHLMVWCENAPADWFYIFIRELSNNRYAVILHPNIQKSIDRFKLRLMYMYEEIPPSDTDYKVLYHPLQFISNPSEVFGQIKSKFGDSIRLGFVDRHEIDVNDPSKVEVEVIKFIGPIKIDSTTKLDLSDYDE